MNERIKSIKENSRDIGEESKIDFDSLDRKKLDDAADMFADPRYLIYGYGTSGKESAAGIMDKGLRSYHNDLAGTAMNLPKTNDTGELHDILDNWKHHNSKQIVLLRLPIEFASRHVGDGTAPPDESPVNMLDATIPLYDDGLSFFKDRNFTGEEDNVYKNLQALWDKRYVLGAYDASTGEIVYSPNYEGEIDYKKDYDRMKEQFIEHENRRSKIDKAWHDWSERRRVEIDECENESMQWDDDEWDDDPSGGWWSDIFDWD